MERTVEEKKEYIGREIKRTWNDVLLDNCCIYSDGAMAFCLCVSAGNGVNSFVSDVMQKNETPEEIVERLNNRIAWTFASEHLCNV